MNASPLGKDQSSPPPLECVFHPGSIAVVGLSANVAGAWLNDCYIAPMLKMGYQGHIYVVNPKGGQIAGLPAYPSLQDVPGSVDYVISCIPAQQTPQLLEECLSKGVKTVQFYTAGFAETGEQEGIDLQRRLVETARRGGMRLVGPNCMGIYCPSSGLGFSLDFPPETGPIGLLCQSGGNTGYIVRSAAARGLRFSKAVSYGNACDINECDLLDYLADDPDTKVIAAYIEGTTDGRRLMASLARAASTKPVVVFKGGYTEGGGRATASHTGSLAGSDAVWSGFLRQVGAIRVYSVEEMTDMLVALLCMKPPRGTKCCAVGAGGGPSVLATDECEQAGLQLPAIPPEIRERLKGLIPVAGSMLSNPIDVFPMVGMLQKRMVGQRDASSWEDLIPKLQVAPGDQGWGDLMVILEDWPELGLVIFHHAFDGPPVPVSDWLINALRPMIAAASLCKLPEAIVLHSVVNNNSWQVLLKAQQICQEAGQPVFLSMRGAALAIRRLIEFEGAHPGKVARLQKSVG